MPTNIRNAMALHHCLLFALKSFNKLQTAPQIFTNISMHHQVEIVNCSLPGCYKNNTCIFFLKKLQSRPINVIHKLANKGNTLVITDSIE